MSDDKFNPQDIGVVITAIAAAFSSVSLALDEMAKTLGAMDSIAVLAAMAICGVAIWYVYVRPQAK